MMQEKIIHFLKNSPGYISGEEISRHVHISRAGIWKYIQELRRLGYDIVAVPHLGYKLNSVPDKLLPLELSYGLQTQAFGQTAFCYDAIDSTMDAAFQRAIEGAEEGTIICAETQSKGKGRMGRVWESPKGRGLYFSLILRPILSPSDVAKLTLMTAVAVSEAVRAASRLDVRIKWPNDLLIDGLKLAGILTEMSAEMDRVRFVIVGLGININTPAGQLPDGAVSLKLAARKSFNRIALLQEILKSLEDWYLKVQTEGFSPVIQQWKELSTTLGRRVRIQEPMGPVEGEAIDLDDHGYLLVRMDNGVMIKKMAGDVVLLDRL